MISPRRPLCLLALLPVVTSFMLYVSSPAWPVVVAIDGLVLAFARERFDRRLRTAADVRDRGRMQVLAALDERTTPQFDDVLQPYGPGGRVFNRLRNEVLASLGRNDQIILVTGASRGSASTRRRSSPGAARSRTITRSAAITGRGTTRSAPSRSPPRCAARRRPSTRPGC